MVFSCCAFVVQVATMKAMLLDRPGGEFRLVDIPMPTPGPAEVLVRVHACGVCRTDLHVVDGDIRDGRYPIVPGHQIVGDIVARGRDADGDIGARIGVSWLGHTCGICAFCAAGRENLCDAAEFTGYQRQGGYAEFVTADPRFCFAIPDRFSATQAAPLLCAGLIGYRALSMAGDARRLGFFGFGNAAHILTQIAVWEGREVYAFTRENDQHGQAFARRLGAVWAGGSDESAPEPLDAAIIFAPAGALVPRALRGVRKGGCVICAGIHMSDIPSFPYADLWGERVIRSVANLTREDGRRLLDVAVRVPVHTEVASYPLQDTAKALDALRDGRIDGAAVIEIL
jgi:alcohol dehydrogenase, propanol-preferring